jgi:hypothetical protein
MWCYKLREYVKHAISANVGNAGGLFRARRKVVKSVARDPAIRFIPCRPVTGTPNPVLQEREGLNGVKPGFLIVCNPAGRVDGCEELAMKEWF